VAVGAILAGSTLAAKAMPSESVGLGTVLSGVATLMLAALTAIILIINARVLQATKDAADATRDAARATQAEAEATVDEAKATREQAEASKAQAETANESLREIRRSRELDFRPYLVRGRLGYATAAGQQLVQLVSIQNIGR